MTKEASSPRYSSSSRTRCRLCGCSCSTAGCEEHSPIQSMAKRSTAKRSTEKITGSGTANDAAGSQDRMTGLQ
ncbi:hypothetical protein OEZ85_004936 [Tetradesmus obliquus]|uniref:Uncharacterized protein n=1 Tax=Tetradesmus obliquus TaxID=3088 RepID=A0ABY8UGC5_TETOB|nr:hypothetical protein OEZ85_004936 [Tetradesmus obliquus]